MGHTLTHLAQRMQARMGWRTDSSRGSSSTPEVPLVTGMSGLRSALPIIGPPPMILPVSSGSPPEAVISSWMGVPMRTR